MRVSFLCTAQYKESHNYAQPKEETNNDKRFERVKRINHLSEGDYQDAGILYRTPSKIDETWEEWRALLYRLSFFLRNSTKTVISFKHGFKCQFFTIYTGAWFIVSLQLHFPFPVFLFLLFLHSIRMPIKKPFLKSQEISLLQSIRSFLFHLKFFTVILRQPTIQMEHTHHFKLLVQSSRNLLNSHKIEQFSVRLDFIGPFDKSEIEM